MTPSREMVNKKRLNSELEIIKQMVPVSCQETVKVCELYLSASEKLPAKKENEAQSAGDRYHAWINLGDVLLKGDETHVKVWNQAIDQVTPLVMRLQGRVEEKDTEIAELKKKLPKTLLFPNRFG